MKTPDGMQALTLTFTCKDGTSVGDKECAAFYGTNRRSFIVQGDSRDEPEVVGQARAFVPEHEGLLEIPETLVDPFVRIYVRERYGIDLGAPQERAD